METKTFGTRIWRNEYGNLHRENDPAIIYADGSKCWYINGKRHCENGPAIINADGTKSWWLNDERHREDGPAVIYPDGTKCWYLNGIKYTEKQYKQEVRKYKLSNLKL